MSSTVLSTRKLERNQKELLLNAGIGLVEVEFIRKEALPFKVRHYPQNIIFTSKTAVKILLASPEKEQLKGKHIFCVGSKTAEFCRNNGLKVVEQASYGADLANIIIENYRNEEFLFFCGNIRQPLLPEKLSKAGIKLKEIEIYATLSVPKKIDRTFEGVLFFSPSAVRSYYSINENRDSIAFCIGKTTAAEAEEFTGKIVVATTPSVENVIVQVVKHLK